MLPFNHMFRFLIYISYQDIKENQIILNQELSYRLMILYQTQWFLRSSGQWSKWYLFEKKTLSILINEKECPRFVKTLYIVVVLPSNWMIHIQISSLNQRSQWNLVRYINCLNLFNIHFLTAIHYFFTRISVIVT
jgi:hypothetical protein